MARRGLMINVLREAQEMEDRRFRIERRLLRDCYNPLDISEVNFIERYRFSKSLFFSLKTEIEPYLKNSNHGLASPVELKLLAALSFYATGSYQRIVGNGTFLCQSAISKCMREVTEALCNSAVANKWISFPMTQRERSCVKEAFYQKFKIPGVIGCVDGTHIAIIKPNIHEEQYYNRKGYHSINTQLICDSNLKILSVNACYGGASHDAHIWSSSQISQYIHDVSQSGESGWVLGDSGYPQRAWLMTPFPNVIEGTPNAMYNGRHIQARNCVERCNGVLKNRWRCLLKHRVLHYAPVVASRIITACCVLHNMALSINMPEPSAVRSHRTQPEINFAEVYEERPRNGNMLLARGIETRNRLVSILN